MATTTKKNTVTVTFVPEKVTKNTVRFTEELESEFAAPVIGTIYVPKSTLGQVGYAEGKKLTVTVGIA